MPVAAAVIGGVAAIGGGVIAASGARSAANTAANAQTAANKAAIAAQERQYNQTRSDLSPWTAAGRSASSAQNDLIGTNGAARQQAAIDALKASPLYASLFGNGRDAILANASATGGLRGGNVQGALANFGRDTLAGVIQQQVANLGSVSEQGQNASAQVDSFGANAVNMNSQLLNNVGAAQGGAALAAGGANIGLARTISGAVASFAENQAVQRALFGQSSGMVAPHTSGFTVAALTPSVRDAIDSNPMIF